MKQLRSKDLSRVTQLVSVGAGARSQPTYPVIAHRVSAHPFPIPREKS